MRIVIDNRYMVKGTGIESVIRNLVQGCRKLTNDYDFIFVGKPLNNKTLFSRVKSKIWEQIILPFLLVKERADVFVAPANIGLPYLKVCKYLLFIHDLAPIVLSDLYSHYKIEKFFYLLFIKIAAKNADQVICDSEATKKDVVEILKIDPKKIEVIYPSIDTYFKKIDSPEIIRDFKNGFGLGRYILTICSNHPNKPIGFSDPRKNVLTVIKAFKLLKEQYGIPHKLVIVGPPYFKERLPEELNRVVGNDIVLTGFVNEEDLVLLYNAADIFIFPSLYEGFGLPPLEAMASGVPVIASQIQVFKEILGEASLLVDPSNPQEIASTINRVLFDVKLSEELKLKGFERIKLFSGNDRIINFLEIFDSIA